MLTFFSQLKKKSEFGLLSQNSDLFFLRKYVFCSAAPSSVICSKFYILNYKSFLFQKPKRWYHRTAWSTQSHSKYCVWLRHVSHSLRCCFAPLFISKHVILMWHSLGLDVSMPKRMRWREKMCLMASSSTSSNNECVKMKRSPSCSTESVKVEGGHTQVTKDCSLDHV